MIQKCFFEILFISQFFWILSPWYTNHFFWNNDTNACSSSSSCKECIASSHVYKWVFLTQFSLAGSELCLFFITIDLYLSLTNPFIHLKKAVKYYSVVVLVLSILSAVILIDQGDKIIGIGTSFYLPIYLSIFLII
jgi:hypothetical protein